MDRARPCRITPWRATPRRVTLDRSDRGQDEANSAYRCIKEYEMEDGGLES
jgi:hypothetical protein